MEGLEEAGGSGGGKLVGNGVELKGRGGARSCGHNLVDSGNIKLEGWGVDTGGCWKHPFIIMWGPHQTAPIMRLWEELYWR
jgi:hypothetical protein